MLRRLQRVPGIAGDDPALGRLILQRVDPLRLARQDADHRPPVEQAAGAALTDERRQIAAEQHVEDGVRIMPRECLRSDEHTSELQSLMRISFAVLCWKQYTYCH